MRPPVGCHRCASGWVYVTTDTVEPCPRCLPDVPRYRRPDEWRPGRDEQTARDPAVVADTRAALETARKDNRR